ncbi:MAG: hypothetical protein DRP94_01230 [Candidatus Latescibacterota bacterium]|nr:MAG: hypothetical protein DRP94_01230 [Candidatus Latescibacterota bacterium]RKY74484.1 MAG: hypothetical protein DRQ14_01825 [Candidatus Latescibacterota bacterium]HDH99703.1 hypothetical protein [Bacillota bacterium]
MELQETQEYLKNNLSGFIACAVVDTEHGMPLVATSIDPNLDLSVPSGFFTEAFLAAVRAFEMTDWGVLREVLIPGDPNTVVMFSLKDGAYYQNICVSSKTPLGMVRAVFNKIRKDLEKELP